MDMNAQCFGDDCALIGWSTCNNHDILSQWNERNNINGTLFDGGPRSHRMKNQDFSGSPRGRPPRACSIAAGAPHGKSQTPAVKH